MARVRARSWARKRAAPQTARARNALLHPAKTQEKIPKTGLAHTIFTGFFGALLVGASMDGLMSTPSTSPVFFEPKNELRIHPNVYQVLFGSSSAGVFVTF